MLNANIIVNIYRLDTDVCISIACGEIYFDSKIVIEAHIYIASNSLR